MEFEQSKKMFAVSGDYSSLQRILKEAFEIDSEILIQKYEADWQDFVDLVDFCGCLKVLRKVHFFVISYKNSFVSK